MTKPMTKIVDSSTGEEIEREMTDEEYSEYLEFVEKINEEQRLFDQQRMARKAILEKLGLTEDEAKILIG